MAEYDIYQVDAFADAAFTGNPAAVVPMTNWADDAVLQAIAEENNLAETAFFRPVGEGRYDLRWFTPVQEVPLCGHATLASAHVLYRHLGVSVAQVSFETRSGTLTVARTGEGAYEMDFPADPPTPTAAPDGLADALGAAPKQVFRGQYLLALFETAEEVDALRPAMTKLEGLADGRLSDCVVAAAPGTLDRAADGTRFVSRFFAPAQGIPEDPVTGSAHCMLAPFFAERLGDRQLRAFQASRRGGRVDCRLAGDRVMLAGAARTYLKGRIFV